MDEFTTHRLIVRNWRADLEIPSRRRWIEDSLGSLLSARVLAHLPQALHLADGDQAVAAWVSARHAQSDVMLVLEASCGDLIGLLLVARNPHAPDRPELHVGYLLGEAAWGRQYATEMVTGLVAALADSGRLRLVSGVGKDNPASVRVLAKAGFSHSPERSSPDTDMFVKTIA